MEEMIFFNNAKENVTNFFEREFENFPPLLMSHFLNKFNDLLNYSEEGTNIKPKISFRLDFSRAQGGMDTGPGNA